MQSVDEFLPNPAGRPRRKCWTAPCSRGGSPSHKGARPLPRMSQRCDIREIGAVGLLQSRRELPDPSPGVESDLGDPAFEFGVVRLTGEVLHGGGCRR